MRFQGLLHLSGYLGEGCGLVDREIGKHFAIEIDFGELQTVHKLAVAQSVRARCRADANDPQRAEVAFLELATGEGKVERALYLLLCVSIELALRAAITAGK